MYRLQFISHPSILAFVEILVDHNIEFIFENNNNNNIFMSKHSLKIYKDNGLETLFYDKFDIEFFPHSKEFLKILQ